MIISHLSVSNHISGVCRLCLISVCSDSASPLVWQAGPWSLCSKSCGGGLQFRTVQCVMRFSERNMTQDVPAAFCESAQARKPSSQRPCGVERCYSWIKSPWSPCDTGDCVATNKGNISTFSIQIQSLKEEIKLMNE